ncbi:ribose 5-phosphate isomerase [Candidatus Protochlamydia naegleriophila]|uniref:Ribose-5-phosphate isomerase A n=1 Tax=Candidatus Protochlamydia naegleriophila TaxID=389348 RepID=A0A0U5K2I4_9BACT|nr:ribose 5-phosphate isomerase A [Candidatus Protochlamydia naegleriophila]CUI16315.1 ribose 5-phosphate isomerase [Candidatus Protochlamydia naegleriophila]
MTKTDFSPIISAKKAAGKAAVELIKEGMLVGLGTGSTTSYFIEALGQRCRSGLNISAVASSVQSMRQAHFEGIPLIDADKITLLDLTIDGADEIDHHKNMIKGGGGALLREKLLALASKEMVVVVDENKLVEQLGAFPVPVEIATFAYRTTLKRLESNGYSCILRLNRDKSLYLTDNGNYIIDIQYQKPIANPKLEHERLKSLAGVLETGLFFNVAGRVVVGYEDGFAKILT